jgi:hypothetical protein
MATKFTKGQTVKAVSVTPEGPIQKLRMDDDGAVFYMIEWTDEAGQPQERWFAEDQLVKV